VPRLAITGSLPDALARRWVAELGLEEAAALARRLRGRAPLTVRTNTLRLSREELARRLETEGARAVPCPLAPAGLRLVELGDPGASAAYQAGLFTPQDEAAQLVSQLVDPQPGEAVLDGCCGVGGKSTHLAALMSDRGRVLCLDVSARKLELLREHCLRLGVTSCEPLEADLRAADRLRPAPVDRVLLDAPCSGLGVLARHPELKWRLDLEAVPRLVALQRELLEAALRWLRPGGVLVYSVCTTTEEEGPAQLRWLLAGHPELTVEPPPPALAALAPEGTLRLWPHRHDTDGFLATRVRLRG